MLRNYCITAIRNFRRNKFFSIINVLGLAIGVSASLVIFLLVNYHFSFDKFEKDRDRIYRVVSTFNFSGENYYNSGVTSPMAPAIKKELPGLDAVVPFRTWDGDAKIGVTVDSKKSAVVFRHQRNIVFADENFFNLIGYKWIAGSAKTSLQQPYQVVLSESSAQIYFPKLPLEEVIGKELLFNDTIRTTVTGVVRDIKQNTDFTFKIFVSRATLENTSLKPADWTEWSSTNGASQLYVKLLPGTSPQKTEKDLYRIYEKYHTPEPGDNSKAGFELQPLNDLRFNAKFGAYELPVAHIPTLYGLLAVALFLLLLGCINFINLTTAQASQRAKEIGIRKTMGSSANQLMVQFLSETFLLTLIATTISIFLTPLILKAFAGFIPAGLKFSLAGEPVVILFLITLLGLVTFLSGIYPAMVLSGYKPILVLKNQAYLHSGKTRGTWLRQSLTISQFVIAQVFLMSTILVTKQITYSLNKDMGFKKDAILHLSTNYYDTVKSNKYFLMDKLSHIPGIAMVSLSNNPPSSNSTWSNTIKYKDGKKEIQTDVQQKTGDTNYIKLYHIKLLAGANITQSDTANQVLINETYSHVLGFQQPQGAVGKYLYWDNNTPIIITGVVADFNQHSLHVPLKPLAIANGNDRSRTINIALKPQNAEGTAWSTTIGQVEKEWKKIYPDDDFEYKFFDEDIAEYYEAEQHISTLLFWCTGLAVFISCLGLLGLVIFTTNQRTKEIGIRKVIGATVIQIVSLLSKDFFRLILIAFVIAVPLAWWGANKWLENFAFRTAITWWVFFGGGLFMIVISFLVLGFKTFKAASANPVKSLRAE